MNNIGTVTRITEALEYLADIGRRQISTDDFDFERFAAGYVDLRKTLAKEYRTLAQGTLISGQTTLDSTLRRIEHRMQERWGGRLPDKYLSVAGYRGVHPILLEYLLKHFGSPVSATRLRVLTGDQVHTERRLRELRDLGYQLSWQRVFDEDHYLLHDREPDLEFASRFQLEHNLKHDRSLSAQERSQHVAVAGHSET